MNETSAGTLARSAACDSSCHRRRSSARSADAVKLKGAGPGPLDVEDEREAMRACKGMVMRQEVYELDLDALYQRNEHRPVRLFSARKRC